jgi:hypothetical protein
MADSTCVWKLDNSWTVNMPRTDLWRVEGWLSAYTVTSVSTGKCTDPNPDCEASATGTILVDCDWIIANLTSSGTITNIRLTVQDENFNILQQTTGTTGILQYSEVFHDKLDCGTADDDERHFQIDISLGFGWQSFNSGRWRGMCGDCEGD